MNIDKKEMLKKFFDSQETIDKIRELINQSKDIKNLREELRFLSSLVEELNLKIKHLEDREKFNIYIEHECAVCKRRFKPIEHSYVYNNGIFVHLSCWSVQKSMDFVRDYKKDE